MNVNPCGHTVPADVTAIVEHLAHCPKTDATVAEWCRVIVAHVAAAVAQAEAAERSRKTITRSCERCGAAFETTNVRKRFCSTACRSGRHRERSEATS